MLLRLLTIWLVLAQTFAPCWSANAYAAPVLVLSSNPPDPSLPTPPEEYQVPSVPTTLAELLTGATRIDVASAAELTSLNTGGTVDGSTLAGAVATGPVVVVLANTDFNGSFTFPALANAHWIYFVTEDYDELPPSGTRTQEADRVSMPRFRAAENGGAANYHHAAMLVAHNSQKYRFIGIEATYLLNSDTGLGIFVAGKSQVSLIGDFDSDSDVPRDIILDRCEFYGRGGAGYSDTKGVNFDVDGGAIVDSRIVEVAGNSGDDPMGIMVTFAGRNLMFNNLEVTASGENIIFGGTDGWRDVHTDIVIRRSYFHKPRHWFKNDPSYDGFNRTIKNLVELKKASRVLIEGCVLEDCGDTDSGQSLTAFTLTVRNQSGTDPNAVVEDVEIKNCLVRRVGAMVTMIGEDNNFPSLETNHIYIHDVVYYDQNFYSQFGEAFYSAITFSQMYAGRSYPHIRVEHNTVVLGPGGFSYQYGNFLRLLTNTSDILNVMPDFVMRDNIFEGYSASTLREAVIAVYTGGPWTPAQGFANICVDEITSNNLATGEDTTERNRYPAGNFFENTAATIGFANYAGATGVLDFLLTSGSYRAGQANDATDGKDLGADIAAVAAATEHTISGNWNQ